MSISTEAECISLRNEWEGCEPCNTDTGLQIFVFVMHKEGLADISPLSPAKPSFDMTPTIKYTQPSLLNAHFHHFHNLYFIVGVITKEGLAGLVPTKLSSGIATTNTLRPVSA